MAVAAEEQSTYDFPPVSELSACVADVSQPLGKRTHAAFYLRTLGGAAAVQALCTALLNTQDSALLRHELGYVLGQMQDEGACDVLERVLSDTSDDVMVRHEVSVIALSICKFFIESIRTKCRGTDSMSTKTCVCVQAAEALGAIGAQRSVALLEQFAQDPAPEVSQTCQVCVI
jgi:deoxyhypusine monooxygenase